MLNEGQLSYGGIFCVLWVAGVDLKERGVQ